MKLSSVVVAATLALLEGCAVPPPSAAVAPEPSPAARVQMVPIAEPMAAPAAHASPTGCIGQDIHVCAATFSQFTRRQAFGDDLERQLARNARIDVNGRPIGTGMVTLFGNAPQGGNFMLSANLDKNNRVTSANISLPGSPDTARTAEEYDQSGLYGGVVILFGRGCVPDKIALYRAFENEIKPTIERSP